MHDLPHTAALRESLIALIADELRSNARVTITDDGSSSTQGSDAVRVCSLLTVAVGKKGIRPREIVVRPNTAARAGYSACTMVRVTVEQNIAR